VPYTEFSNNWSSYTGEAIVKCVDDDSVCPTEKDKKKVRAGAEVSIAWH